VHHMFIDLSAFIDQHSALIARAYEQSGAARWALSFDDFACVLHVSISASGESAAVAIGSLRLSDLALAAACRAGIEDAWEEFVRRYRPILYSAARGYRRRRVPGTRAGRFLVCRLVRDGTPAKAAPVVRPLPWPQLVDDLAARRAGPALCGLPARIAALGSARKSD
jgi:hypothetical protein